MERSTYRALVDRLTLPLSSWPHFAAIARLFGVSVDTAFSIYSLEVQSRVLRTNHIVKAGMEGYRRRYLAGEDAVQLAFQLDFPPCVLLRRLLEALQLGLAKERITRVLRSPDQLAALVSPEGLAALAGAVAAAAAAVDLVASSSSGGGGATDSKDGATAASTQQQQRPLLERLQRDVEVCVLCDRIYSPASDAARHRAGIEYEERLNAALAAAGVAFWTEDQLRSKGYHKTPDARLQVPIAVQGRIVNWIDSKATFGDDKTHRQQTAEQYERYVNRFGPGLVIYWHGFIADLNKDENVLLMDRFPRAEEIVQLPCLPLTLAAPLPEATVAAAAIAAGQPLSAATAAAASGESEAAVPAAAVAAATDGADQGGAAAQAAAPQHAAQWTPVRLTAAQQQRTPARPTAKPGNCFAEITPVRKC